MALRIPAILFFVVLVDTGDARRVRVSDAKETLEANCKKLFVGQYCPIISDDKWLLDSMVAKSENDWECMVIFAEQAEPVEQCKHNLGVLKELMKSYKASSGGHKTVTEQKVQTFKEILGLPAGDEASPSKPVTVEAVEAKAEVKDDVVEAVVDVPVTSDIPAAAKVDVAIEPVEAEALEGDGDDGCWCPRLTAGGHANRQGGLEKKFKTDLFAYDNAEKKGLECRTCKECYSAMQSSQVVSCCGSRSDGAADINQCAPTFKKPDFESSVCVCNGLRKGKSDIWHAQAKKTCWPKTPCYAKSGPQCCP